MSTPPVPSRRHELAPVALDAQDRAGRPRDAVEKRAPPGDNRAVVRPFRILRPERRALPVLVSVPHAGLAVPAEIEPELCIDERMLRANADLAVDALYDGAARAGATLLVADVSRFVVDLNRSTGDVDSVSVPQHPAPLADARRGLIWRVATCGRPVLARPLTLAQLELRVRRFHAPYHDALATLLHELRDRFGFAILIDGHSMPPVARGDNGNARRYADIVPGCLGGASCAAALVREACRFFDTRGYSVAVDDPYRGGYITRHYGRPRDGWHALQIEINRDLYLDRVSLELRPRGFARLQGDLAAFVESLSSLDLV
jgi:N-formylglutamate amidohydrolase